MTRAAKALILRCLIEVRGLMAALEEGMSVPAWRQAFARVLARYHAASYMVGQDGKPLAPADRRTVARAVSAQVGYLDRWALEVQAAPEFMAGWKARGAMYAQGIGASYWRGATKVLPLPAMPKDGTTQCLTNCGCSWEIVELEGDGNYDCFWRRAKDDSCATCIERERNWSPLRIREGRLEV